MFVGVLATSLGGTLQTHHMYPMLNGKRRGSDVSTWNTRGVFISNPQFIKVVG